MEEICKHTDIVAEVKDGVLVTYCKKCGKILDTRKVGNQTKWDESYSTGSDGTTILHG